MVRLEVCLLAEAAYAFLELLYDIAVEVRGVQDEQCLFAAHRGTAAASTTSASMRRSTVMRSRATDGRSASECQGKRPDQALKHHSDALECWEPSTLSHLGFQPVQKTPTIHASSGFIWGIPGSRTQQRLAEGSRRLKGAGQNLKGSGPSSGTQIPGGEVPYVDHTAHSHPTRSVREREG